MHMDINTDYLQASRINSLGMSDTDKVVTAFPGVRQEVEKAKLVRRHNKRSPKHSLAEQDARVPV